MGFLDSIGTLLGGFNDVKQIDKDGFDFREKRRQDELARQQEQQRWQQANQDYDVKAGAEAAVGGMSENDLGSTLPAQLSNEQRKAAIARMIGQSAQSKSALEGQRAYTAETLQRVKGQNALDVAGVRTKAAEEVVRLREKLRAGQQLSPREQAMLTSDEKMNADRIAAGDRRAASSSGGPGGHRKVIKIAGTRNGVSGTVMRDQDTYEELGFEPSPTTAATRGKEEAKGAAMKAYEAIRGLRAQMPTPEGWMEANATGLGRQVGAMTQANPVANRYKASIRGFVPLMARALGHVGVLTELDVERTEDLFSGLGATAETDRISDEMLRKIMSGEVPFQFGQGGGKPVRTGIAAQIERIVECSTGRQDLA